MSQWWLNKDEGDELTHEMTKAEAAGIMRWLDGCKGDVGLTVSYMSAVLGIAPPSVCRAWVLKAKEVSNGHDD